jgi:uncharacterized tellurite resistance protein B-like protein
MSDFWGELGKTIGKTQQALDAARKEAERLASEAGRGLSSSLGQMQELVTGEAPTEPVNIAALPEHQRVAYAGALYALASADGGLDKDEIQLIIDLVDLAGLSSAGRGLVLGYVVTPPELAATLAPFVAVPETIRYALLLNLVEVAWANDLLDPRQDALLTSAQQALHVSDEQYRAIWRFMRELRAIRLRGRNDPAAAEATRVAAAGLAAVGIPIAAVYVSGSVIGLSAAGITSGLAALGLGLGMVPGIGVAVLMGLGAFLGVRALLDATNQSDQAQLRGELARRAQDVIASLDEMIALLDAQIRTLDQAGDTRTTGFRLAALHERRRALQQIMARRRAMTEATTTAG